MSASKSLEDEFHKRMLDIHKKALKECHFNGHYFLRMVVYHGGVAAAKQLLNTDESQSGFTELHLCGRLDLTTEHLVLEPEFRSLFSEDELKEARSRLTEYGYHFP